MALLVCAGPTLQKMVVYFKEFNATGPILAETGTTEYWPKGVEIKLLKRSIQRRYSYYAGKLLYIYTLHSEDAPGREGAMLGRICDQWGAAAHGKRDRVAAAHPRAGMHRAAGLGHGR